MANNRNSKSHHLRVLANNTIEIEYSPTTLRNRFAPFCTRPFSGIVLCRIQRIQIDVSRGPRTWIIHTHARASGTFYEPAPVRLKKNYVIYARRTDSERLNPATTQRERTRAARAAAEIFGRDSGAAIRTTATTTTAAVHETTVSIIIHGRLSAGNHTAHV